MVDLSHCFYKIICCSTAAYYDIDLLMLHGFVYMSQRLWLLGALSVYIYAKVCVCVYVQKGVTQRRAIKKKSTGKGVFPIPLVFFGLRCVIIFCTVCTNHSNNLFCYDIFQCAGLFRFMLLVIICTTRMCTLIYADVALYMLTLLMWLYYAVLCVFVSYLYCTRARCTHSCIQVLPQQYFESFSFSFVIVTDIIAAGESPE